MNRVRFTTLIALLGAAVAFGQQPTISNVVVASLDSSSVRIFFDVSGVPGAWAELYYGTQSGVYPYNSKSANCYERTDACQGEGTTSLVLTGLKPATDYYIRPTARPNRDDDTNICNTAGCGAAELMITTLDVPVPSPPVSPTDWKPTPPDTTGYSLITLEVGPSGECQAAQTVTSPDGWTVPAGTTVGAALGMVGYGTVFELPQGLACKVPPAPGGVGYVLPSKPLDNNCGGACAMTDPNHRWIVFRTAQGSAADFPEFGSRTNPSYAPRLGKFYSSQPNTVSQLFDAEAGQNSIHHFWFENLEFMDDPAYANPADYVDPDAFAYFARLGSTYQNENNQFIVLDRVYSHGPGAPIRHYQGFEIGGNYIGMIGNYTAGVESWRMTAWPGTSGSLQSSDTQLAIPQNNYRFERSGPMLGMNAPATATLSGITAAGTVVGNLYKDHLEVQYTSGIGTLACTGCTATAATTPSTPRTAIRLFAGAINANGTFGNIGWNTAEYQTSKYLMSFGVMTSDLKGPGGPYYIENNYLDGIGEGFYMDTQYSPYSNDDVTFTHNHHIWPKQAFSKDADNEWRYAVRQHFEAKRLHRGLLQGNMFSYSWAQYNDGPALLLSSRMPYTVNTANNDGVTDIRIESNIVSHGRSGIECSSGNPMTNGGTLPEPEPIKRVSIKNNLLFDLGLWLYCDEFCPGLLSEAFLARPVCQDLVIEHNTVGPMYASFPPLIFAGGGHTLGNYLSFRKNLVYVDRGQNSQGGLIWGDWNNNGVANHPVIPSATYYNSGPSPDFVGSLGTTFVNIADTVVPNYDWEDNVLIGGWKDTNLTLAGIQDMDFNEVQTFLANRPPGDTLVKGNTMADRGKAVNLVDPKNFDFRVTAPSKANPGDAGVDFEKLYHDTGMVTAIEQPRLSTSQAEFTYTAPDTRACVVDMAPSGVAPLNWTRTSDGGGARRRTVTVNGLTANTSYEYRIVCYFEQVNDGILYTDYKRDQITSGTLQTPPVEQAAARVPFVLGSVPGSTSVRVTLTPLAGPSTNQVCSNSPCVLTVDKGDYEMQMEFLDSTNAVLTGGTGDLQVR